MNALVAERAHLATAITRDTMLRPLREADRTAYVALYSDADAMAFIAPPLSKERARASFDTVLRDGARARPRHRGYVVRDVIDDAWLGVAGISGVDYSRSRCEVGMILRREARARGVATRALAELVTVAFDTLPVDEVWVRFAPTHEAARRLVARLGFVAGGEAPLGTGGSSMLISSAYRASWCGSQSMDARGVTNAQFD